MGKHDIVIETLRAAYSRFAKEPRFRPGNWVTPAPNSPLSNSGTPCLVVEIGDLPPDEKIPSATSFHGRRPDMRVILTSDEADGKTRVHALWTYSEEYEPYNPETHGHG